MTFFRASALALSTSLALSGGCTNMINHVGADVTGDVMRAASPKLQAHWDVDLFGAGLPGLILQMEGLLGISPQNEVLLIELTKAYCQYSYGWVENEYEITENTGDLDKADVQRARAIKLYLYARDLGLRAMREVDDGIDDALADPSNLPAYLKKHYSYEDDAELIFWTGMAWGSAVNIGRDDPDLVADLDTVRAFGEAAVRLDPTYYSGAPLILMGVLEAALPAALGGNPKAAKAYFEKAAKVSKRTNGVMLVQYARGYAMPVGDEDLYRKLLNEALEQGDPGPELRLGNEVAKRRAARYLETMEDEF